VHRIVFQHVGEIVRLEQVVDGDDFDIREILRGGAKHHTSDATEPVDAYFDGH
jgi:hypothetical protein